MVRGDASTGNIFDIFRLYRLHGVAVFEEVSGNIRRGRMVSLTRKGGHITANGC